MSRISLLNLSTSHNLPASCYLNLEPLQEKEYIRYFNGDVLPLTLRGVSYEVPKAVTDTVRRRLHACPHIKVRAVH